MEKKKAGKKNDKNIENERIADEILSKPIVNDSDSIETLYSNNIARNYVQSIDVKIDSPSAKVLYMSELLIGNQDSDVDFFFNTVNQIKLLPADQKPDLVVFSGAVQGDFKMLQKARRATLVPGIDGMGAQFHFARQALDKLCEIGAPVIYNMGNDDRRIAEEYNIEVFRKMSQFAKDHRKKDESQKDIKPEDVMNWANIDRMRTNSHWQEHLNFQIEEIFPYCLKAGRRLYTAKEMSKRTDGRIKQEEYFVLYDAKQRISRNLEPTSEQSWWLEKVAETRNDNITVTDDVNLNIETRDREYHDMIRHNLGFSPEPMYQNHMKNSIELLGHMACSKNISAPDMLVTEHNQEEVGASFGDSWAISTGGLLRADRHINTKGSKSDYAQGDVSKRLSRTRRRVPSPSAAIHERTDDDRHIITFFNNAQLEKSFSLPERTTIAELSDFQTGSITARPDLLAKYLDYIRVRVIGEGATSLFFGGDMMHGRNYPHFPSESQMTGLMAMDTQEKFNTDLFEQSFADMSGEEIKSIGKILIQPGNHEWNSGTLKWHGYSFVSYMRNFFEKIYARAGYDDQTIHDIVKTHEAITTPSGEYATGSTGIEYFGDLGVLIKHYFLDRNGKGSNNSLPIYQGSSMVNGSGDLFKNIDIMMAGHWHHPQYAMFGDKITVIGGSIAGLSAYELDRGYRPTISGTLIHIGGGKPPKLEFISEKTLNNYEIQKGNLTNEKLAEEGLSTDDGFDPARNGIFLPDRFSKSALQKKILKMMKNASQRSDSIAVFK